MPGPAATAPADDGDDIYALADAPARPRPSGACRVAAGGGSQRPRGRRGGRAERKTLDPRRVLAAFGGRIEPVRPTLLYRLWILIVAAVMVTLPLVYVAIIGLVVAAVAYHAIHNVSIFSAVRGGHALKFAAVVYIAPLVAGAMVVVLMIKPLFARPARGPKSRGSTPEPSRCCTPSWTACATRSARRGRRGSRSIAGSTPRRTATGGSSACWAAS